MIILETKLLWNLIYKCETTCLYVDKSGKGAMESPMYNVLQQRKQVCLAAQINLSDYVL